MKTKCDQPKIILGLFLIAFLIFTLLNGCSASRTRLPISEETSGESLPNLGDAFLYDVKIYRNGKKNSVRLDLYHLNESISLYTRGYLGKGVLKGLIYSDSAIIYLPTEDEFYTGKLEKLVNESCFENILLEKILIEMFLKTPPEINELQSDFEITIIEDKNDVKEFLMSSKKCGESLEIKYKLVKDRLLPKEIKYENQDKSFKITAKSRKHKLSVRIPTKKIELDIPSSAQRIVP